MDFLHALNEGGGAAEASAYLDAGGDINAPVVPMIEQTLLHYAAIERRGDLIALLARRGADLDVWNAFGMTALHLAVMHEIDAALMVQQAPSFSCARTLTRLGASREVLDNHGRTPRDIAKMYGAAMRDLFDEATR